MQVALVTGASRGIGLAIATRLARHGYAVGCAARDEEALDRLVTGISAESGSALGIAFDVREPDDCRHAAASVEERFGPIDVLVNNAGIGGFAPAQELEVAEWDRIVSTNLSGVFYLTRAVLPGMVSRGRGHVVTIASIAGHRGFAGGAAYAASKHALVGFHESLMLDVRGKGVRTTLISPGSVDTAFFPDDDRDRGWMLRPEDVAQAVEFALAAREGALVEQIVLRPHRPPSSV